MSRVPFRTFASLYSRQPSVLAARTVSSHAVSQLSGSDEQQFDPLRQRNLNEHITRVLEKKALFHLEFHSEDDPSRFKYVGYRNAINEIRNWPKKLESGKEASQMRFIGKRLAAKIDEIIKTGKLESLADDRLKGVQDLQRVHGLMYNDAKALYEQGITSIEDLKENTHLLSEEQVTALKYLELTEMEIPRNEATEIEDFIRSTLNKVDENFFVQGVGAYRLRTPIVGGMDLILTHPHFSNVVRKETDGDAIPHLMVVMAVDAFRSSGVLLANLAPTEKYKFVGMLQPGKKNSARLIRLHVVTAEEYPYALLYLTGTARYVRQLKARAAYMFGFKNKEYGLKRPTEEGQAPLPVQSEEEIFEVLNLVYADPALRHTISRRTELPLVNDPSGETMGDGWGVQLPEDLLPLPTAAASDI